MAFLLEKSVAESIDMGLYCTKTRISFDTCVPFMYCLDGERLIVTFSVKWIQMNYLLCIFRSSSLAFFYINIVDQI